MCVHGNVLSNAADDYGGKAGFFFFICSIRRRSLCCKFYILHVALAFYFAPLYHKPEDLPLSSSKSNVKLAWELDSEKMAGFYVVTEILILQVVFDFFFPLSSILQKKNEGNNKWKKEEVCSPIALTKSLKY